MASIQTLKDTATQVRRDIVRMVHGVQSGHPGGSLGCTDFLTALYFHTLDHNPAFTMDGNGEDLFGRSYVPIEYIKIEDNNFLPPNYNLYLGIYKAYH